MNGSAIVSKILAESGMSKSALSAASGVSRSLIDDYLKNRSQPSVAQVRRLAEAAGCSLDITVRKNDEHASAVKEFIAVLEFGEHFPAKPRKPLINLKPIWDAAAARPHSTEGG